MYAFLEEDLHVYPDAESASARCSSIMFQPRGLSLVIAELFYKFHSFTLEWVAILATWYVLDFVRKVVADELRR